MLSTLLILPSTAFAQESLVVKPEFSEDHSDACSILAKKVTMTEFYNFPEHYITVHNNTNTTTVYYGDTKLLVTFSPLNITGNLGYIYDGSFGPPPAVLKSDSKLLLAPTMKKISLEFSKTTSFTEALTNVGNKTEDVAHSFYPLLFEVLYFKNGTMLPSYSAFVNNLPYSPGIPEWPEITKTTLEPGQSILEHTDLTMLGWPNSDHPPPGNYTLKVFARVVGDVNGTCTTVFLWSQPVDLTVLPEEKVPEFPFAIPILLIGIMSILVLYRMKSSSKFRI